LSRKNTQTWRGQDLSGDPSAANHSADDAVSTELHKIEETLEEQGADRKRMKRTLSHISEQSEHQQALQVHDSRLLEALVEKVDNLTHSIMQLKRMHATSQRGMKRHSST